jgi:hypothetical protein
MAGAGEEGGQEHGEGRGEQPGFSELKEAPVD